MKVNVNMYRSQGSGRGTWGPIDWLGWAGFSSCQPAGRSGSSSLSGKQTEQKEKHANFAGLCAQGVWGAGGFWLAQSEFYFVVRRDICIAYARAPGSQNPQNPQYPQFSAAAVSMVTLATWASRGFHWAGGLISVRWGGVLLRVQSPG